ncbi:hypothetical protein ACFYNO_39750 [Kitasatospora sp. NPDC006697]|uniref:hypothetical protein n=1 Tax=Kitasatospora sp. NPDC006697 TaxID=3364020 RepID=UPI003677DF8D
MSSALKTILEADATGLAAREVAAAITARDVTAMAARLVGAARDLRTGRLTASQRRRTRIAAAVERAAAPLDAGGPDA